MNEQTLSNVNQNPEVKETANTEFVKGCDLFGRALMAYLAFKSVNLLAEQQKLKNRPLT